MKLHMNSVDLPDLESWSDEIILRNPYRAHRFFTKEEIIKVLKSELNLACVAGEVWAKVINGTPEAYAVLSPLEWESDFFGVKMGRLHFLKSNNCPDEIFRELIHSSLVKAETDGFRHLSVSVDSDNYFLVNALCGFGFEIVDIRRLYIAKKVPVVDRFYGAITPREFQESDFCKVRELLRSTNFQSRFSRDSSLSVSKVSDLYASWFNKYRNFDKEKEVLYVAEKAGEIVACGGSREISFSSLGVDKKILGDGIFACNSKGVGSYYSVIAKGIIKGLKSYSLLETRVSNNNLPAIRVLESLGCTSAVSDIAMRWVR